MVEEGKLGADGYVRSAVLKYNSTKNVFHVTSRAVPSLVVIQKVDEIDQMQEVGMSVQMDTDE